MTTGQFLIEVLVYALTLWLGLYLMGRNANNLRLRYAALGCLGYALTLAGDLLQSYLPPESIITRSYGVWLFLPALFWLRTLIELLPGSHPHQERYRQGWLYGLLPLVSTHILASLIWPLSAENSLSQGLYLAVALVLLLPLLGALVLIWQEFKDRQPKRPRGLLLAATLFFTLGIAPLLFPLDFLPQSLLLLAIGGDMMGLGFAIAWLDAFEEGESLRSDFVRSFEGSFFAVLLFGGLVMQTMLLGTGITLPMLLLLLATIAAAIATQTFSDTIQTWLDQMAFASVPQLQEARAELRTEASLLPRIDDAFDLTTLEAKEWQRLTRRALSHMGDLPRLATSPLARLPLVYIRLHQKGKPEDTLERAAELKSLLTESILRLKPRDKGDFDTTSEWRHYNALYFPYVVGLKPYSRRATHDDLDPTSTEALDWFRTYVPNRTLYNWQNKAAALVAQDLQERQEALEETYWPNKQIA